MMLSGHSVLFGQRAFEISFLNKYFVMPTKAGIQLFLKAWQAVSPIRSFGADKE